MSVLKKRWCDASGGFKTHLVIVILSILLGGSVLLHFQGILKKGGERLDRTEMIALARDVLELGVVEVGVSQMYEVRKDRLRVMNVPVPLTRQKSVVVAVGTALVGFDLGKASFDLGQNEREVVVSVPRPKVLSLDLNFRVLFENDTFLNRIQPTDRNEIFARIKKQIGDSILTNQNRSRANRRVEEILGKLSRNTGVQFSLRGLGR